MSKSPVKISLGEARRLAASAPESAEERRQKERETETENVLSPTKGEIAIIEAVMSLCAACGRFSAMCYDNIFYGVQYDPETAKDLLSDIMREIVSVCKALGISFADVVAESTRQDTPPCTESTQEMQRGKWKAARGVLAGVPAPDPHTMDDDFRRFLAYSGNGCKPDEEIALLREGFGAAWEPRLSAEPVRADGHTIATQNKDDAIYAASAIPGTIQAGWRAD